MLVINHYQSNNIKAVVSLFGFFLYTDNCSNTCRDFGIKFVIYNIINNQMPSISTTSDYQYTYRVLLNQRLFGDEEKNIIQTLISCQIDFSMSILH